MPSVSDDLLRWLDHVQPPVICPFSDHMTPDDALRQVCFANGVLWLRNKIKQENEKNRARTQVAGM